MQLDRLHPMPHDMEPNLLSPGSYKVLLKKLLVQCHARTSQALLKVYWPVASTCEERKHALHPSDLEACSRRGQKPFYVIHVYNIKLHAKKRPAPLCQPSVDQSKHTVPIDSSGAADFESVSRTVTVLSKTEIKTSSSSGPCIHTVCPVLQVDLVNLASGW